MSQPYLALFSAVTFFVFITIKYSSSDEAAAAAAASTTALSIYQKRESIPLHPAVLKLGRAVAEGCLNSPVLGSYADFKVDKVHDLFFRVASRFFKACDIYDPRLPEIVAQAGKEVGLVSSRLFFYANGYALAKLLRIGGALSNDNTDYLALRIVGAVELVACTDGLSNTETTMNATVLGFFIVLFKYGLTTYESMERLTYLFAEELKRLAGKY